MPGLCATIITESVAAGSVLRAASHASPGASYRAGSNRMAPGNFIARAAASAVSFARAAGEDTIASGTASSFAIARPIRNASSFPREAKDRSKSDWPGTPGSAFACLIRRMVFMASKCTLSGP